MAYNESAANRVRKLLKRRKGFAERKMFGGIAFLLNGNMCCGVVDDDLVLRLGPELAAEALDKPHTREMDFTGKSLKSMVYLAPTGYKPLSGDGSARSPNSPPHCRPSSSPSGRPARPRRDNRGTAAVPARCVAAAGRAA